MDKNVEAKVVETVVEPVTEEVVKTLPCDAKTVAIVVGSAAAGVGTYILTTQVVIPKVKKLKGKLMEKKKTKMVKVSTDSTEKK